MSAVRPTQTHECDALQLQELYRRGDLSPRDVVEDCISRIERINPEINSVLVVLVERARAAAAESERRWREGAPRPLEGVPIGVKDVADIAGVPTTGGSALYLDHIADRDAEVIRRTENAGGVVIAKDATTEFAIGGPHNPTFGTVRNPWDLTRWSGGSSTGAAASVAARMYPLAIGSDAAGSIRMPASWCGLTGLKTTTGAVPRTGVLPLSWTTETVGPIGRSATDVARFFAVLRGLDTADPRSVPTPADGLDSLASGHVPSDLEGVRIGIARDYYCNGVLLGWWALAAAAVVAGPGLVLASSAPGGPGECAGQAGGWGEDEGGEQTPYLVAAQRDQAGPLGWRSPFSASCARVTDR